MQFSDPHGPQLRVLQLPWWSLEEHPLHHSCGRSKRVREMQRAGVHDAPAHQQGEVPVKSLRSSKTSSTSERGTNLPKRPATESQADSAMA